MTVLEMKSHQVFWKVIKFNLYSLMERGIVRESGMKWPWLQLKYILLDLESGMLTTIPQQNLCR